jgi:hypothetical protein
MVFVRLLIMHDQRGRSTGLGLASRRHRRRVRHWKPHDLDILPCLAEGVGAHDVVAERAFALKGVFLVAGRILIHRRNESPRELFHEMEAVAFYHHGANRRCCLK